MNPEDIYCQHHDRQGACLVCVMMFMKTVVDADKVSADKVSDNISH